MECPDCRKVLKLRMIKHERKTLPSEEGTVVKWRDLSANCMCGYSFSAEIDEKTVDEKHGRD